MACLMKICHLLLKILDWSAETTTDEELTFGLRIHELPCQFADRTESKRTVYFSSSIGGDN